MNWGFDDKNQSSPYFEKYWIHLSGRIGRNDCFCHFQAIQSSLQTERLECVSFQILWIQKRVLNRGLNHELQPIVLHKKELEYSEVLNTSGFFAIFWRSNTDLNGKHLTNTLKDKCIPFIVSYIHISIYRQLQRRAIKIRNTGDFYPDFFNCTIANCLTQLQEQLLCNIWKKNEIILVLEVVLKLKKLEKFLNLKMLLAFFS